MALRILYVENDPQSAQKLEPFFQRLEELTDLSILRVASGDEVFAAASSMGSDVVVIGTSLANEAPLDFAQTLAKKLPLIDSAIVSELPAEEFHEVTEGLGVFMQLPPVSGTDEAETFYAKLQKIRQLLNA